MNEDWRARWVAMHEARAAGRSVKDIAAEYKIGVVRVRQLLKKTWAADRLRCGWAARTHCKNGHPYTEDNIYRAPGSPNVRYCRKCQLNARANKKKPHRWTSYFIQDHDLNGRPFVDMRTIYHRVDLSDLSEPHLSAVKESLERYGKPVGK